MARAFCISLLVFLNAAVLIQSLVPRDRWMLSHLLNGWSKGAATDQFLQKTLEEILAKHFTVTSSNPTKPPVQTTPTTTTDIPTTTGTLKTTEIPTVETVKPRERRFIDGGLSSIWDKGATMDLSALTLQLEELLKFGFISEKQVQSILAEAAAMHSTTTGTTAGTTDGTATGQ